MLPIAGDRSPKVWRNSTARALVWASFWLFTSSSPSTWAALMPSTAVLRRSQLRAATAASSEEARPRLPSVGRIDDGVPKEFHRSSEPRRAPAAFCAAVGSAVPRESRSESPAGESPNVIRSGVAGAAWGEVSPTAGSCDSPVTRVVATRAAAAMPSRLRRDPGRDVFKVMPRKRASGCRVTRTPVETIIGSIQTEWATVVRCEQSVDSPSVLSSPSRWPRWPISRSTCAGPGTPRRRTSSGRWTPISGSPRTVTRCGSWAPSAASG